MWLYNIYLLIILLTKPNIKPRIKLEYNNTWITFNIRPNDASLSCYLMDDVWYCTDDIFLIKDIDLEDSY